MSSLTLGITLGIMLGLMVGMASRPYSTFPLFTRVSGENDKSKKRLDHSEPTPLSCIYLSRFALFQPLAYIDCVFYLIPIKSLSGYIWATVV